MWRRIINSASIVLLALVCVSFSGCGGWWSDASHSTVWPPLPPAVPLTSNADVTEKVIRELELKVKRDKEDFVAYNKLAGYYLLRLRETGSVDYLNLASRTVQASAEIMPLEMNKGALIALAQVEYASHDFAAARDNATQLVEQSYDNKALPYEILGDALLELGDYEKAEADFKKIVRPGDVTLGSEIRLGRLDLLRGRTAAAEQHFSNALVLALNQNVPQRETVAWCRWQLGEVAFSVGNYETAECHYRDSLTTFPDYYRALGSLGRVRAGRGDIPGAIEQYEKVVNIIPDPTFVAALGDLYKLSGREKEASSQYALVEQIGHLSKLNGTLYNRQLALFYADHDMKPEEAYANAAGEYAVRRDVYGADAVAWTALKAGKLAEAQAAIKEALRLGTRDAKLFYHAGMIARAAGDKASARDYLSRALTLNPQFYPLQASIARKALEEIDK